MSDVKRSPKPQILFEENREAFNRAVEKGQRPDFSNQNLSDLDLSGFNLKTANLAGAYLRGANLNGQDLSEANLHGASLKQAKISGCLFPTNISAEEIRLSVDLGTRMRQS
ncbi:MAG: pentapeptide repeat-containing protein [Candidatus Adiutrix sp.]|jgi:uncharacterized protein YjbI with pentapeptide repeats|nr:pentapeptide repeat-containing protein [Candidatus Adiutrix sp.]